MNNLGMISYYAASTGIAFFSHSFRSLANYFETLSSPTILGIIVVSGVLIAYLFGDRGGKRKWFVKQLETLPGPMAFPLIGNAPDLLFPPEEIFSWLENVYHEWGDIVRFWVLRNPKVFVNSYDIAMQLLTRKNFLLKSEEFLPLSPIAEHSLPGTTPEVHPIRRKILAPGYSRQKVEESVNVFAKYAIQTCDKLKGMSDSNAVFNALTYTGLCSYKIGCETSFGIEIMKNLCENDYREQMEAWHTMLVHIVRRSLQPWFKYDFIYNLTPSGKQVQKCFRVINRFAENAISLRRTRRRYLNTQTRSQNQRSAFIVNESPENEPSAQSNQTHECFLDLLLDLEERKELTETAVLHELNIFIVAGYDTTGTTAGWVLHFLSCYPEHQEKVVAELQEIFADHSRPLTSSSISVSDTKRMKYLECCIKETLRICPALPWLLRRTNEDILLNDGRIIPAGVDVPINTYIIHRDPSKFQKPDEFRPERHSVESSSPRSPILPFGAGPRICPGMLFAMFELKVMLTHLLLEYSWESTDDPTKIKHLFQGVLLPENGINVNIKKR